MLCRKYWKWEESASDGSVPKADLIKDEIEECDYDANMDAAEACPVNVIHIFDGDKKII